MVRVRKLFNLPIFWILLFSVVFLVGVSILFIRFESSYQEAPHAETFSFYITSDMREYSGEGNYDTREYFAGALESIRDSNTIGDFMIIPGDLDPVSQVDFSIEKYLGEEYIWLATVGNHELPDQGKESYDGQNIDIIDKLLINTPFEINNGPETCPNSTYSFDYKDVHFVVLNQYCDDISDRNTDGKMSELLLSWLQEDIKEYSEEKILVFGHEPAYPIEDIDSNRLRHEDDSLNQYPESRDEFWKMLNQYNVDAYICGHTHNLSMQKFDNVWQIDSGHARGLGDTGSPSTYIRVDVGEEIEIVVFRMEDIDIGYQERYQLNLTSGITPIY